MPLPGTPRNPSRCAALTRRSLLLGGIAALSACGLPQQGPTTTAVLEAAEEKTFLMIEVDDAIARTLGDPPATSVADLSLDPSAAPSEAVGIGDVLNIRILEAGSGGLFATANGGAGGTDFQDVTVGRSGRIALPYVGEIPVVGRTPVQIEALIVENLQGKAIEPQALVRIAMSSGNRAVISGTVGSPGPFQLSLSGDRLSAAIAAAGGSTHPAHETTVTILRNARQARARLSDILLRPGNDIPLQRDDLVVLSHEPPRYTLSGAVGQPDTYRIETPRYSLLEAITAAGGARDERANPAGVFLFRHESRRRLGRAGIPALDTYPITDAGLPTVYRFDMSRPETQFIAQRFLLADGDAIFVTNAASISLGKLLSLFDLGAGAVNRAQSITE